MASPPVSIAEVFYAGQDALMGKVHTSLPARVEAYDAAAQTAHCQPMVKRLMFDEAGEKVYESLPLLPHVPVCFPRGGGYVFVFPLAPGDFVWLNFSETAMAEYLATGKESAAWDNRRFHLSNAIAIPGVYPDTKPMTNGNTGGMVLGKDGAAEQVRIAPGEILVGAGAQEFVALATKTLNELAIIKQEMAAMVLAFNSHTHLSAAPSSPTGPSVPQQVNPAAANSVAATLVKAQ